MEKFYGKDPQASPDYGRIVNERHFERLAGLLREGKAAVGGRTARAQRYIAPTILDDVSWDSAVMQEEIFGPILPVLEFEDLDAAIQALQARPKPLALLFLQPGARGRRGARVSSGGRASTHLAVPPAPALRRRGREPHGGVTARRLDPFSHSRGVWRRATWADLNQEPALTGAARGAAQAHFLLV